MKLAALEAASSSTQGSGWARSEEADHLSWGTTKGSTLTMLARSPIIMHVAWVLPLGGKGMTEASAMRSPLTPCTRSRRSATPSLMEDARRQVPGWG